MLIYTTTIPRKSYIPQYPIYKINYNNTFDAITCLTCPYIQYTPFRGALIAMIHKTIAFSSNITKLKTPIELTTYLQIITIANKPLTHYHPSFVQALAQRTICRVESTLINLTNKWVWELICKRHPSFLMAWYNLLKTIVHSLSLDDVNYDS